MENENNTIATPEVTDNSISATANLNVNGDTSKETNTFDFDSFINAIPEDSRDVFTKNGVKDIDTLAKSYKGLLEMKGKKGLVKPSDDAPDADKQAYRDALLNEMGRPEGGEYTFDIPDTVADEYVSDDFLNDLADTAYKNGMSQEGFSELINKMYTAYGKHIESINEWKAGIESKMKPDSVDDNSETSQSTKADFSQQAKDKQKEARDAIQANDYRLADQLQKEARELLAKAL